MRHWLVTRRDELEQFEVITQQGKTPQSSGYDKEFYRWRELGEDEVEAREVEKHRPGLLDYVRRRAGEKIVETAPLWQQINDLAEPNAVGAQARREHVATIRAWSNTIEEKISAATTIADLDAVRADIEELQ
jgi:hypothetical protein